MSERLEILALNWRCIHHPQAGGAEINLFEQARRWSQAGHRVTVICAQAPGGALPSSETIDGVHVRRMGGRFTVYLLAALFMARFGRRFDCVLDVANGIPFFSPLFTRSRVVLLVHHVHDRQWFVEFPAPLAALGWFLEQRVVPRLYRHNTVIAVSETTRAALVETGFAPSQVQVVHNGAAAAPLAAGAAPPAPRVIYVGRLKRYKRVERLVRAVAALRSDFPAIHLDIVGEGDTRDELAALVERLDAREQVTLHGFVSEERKTALLRQARVFATASMHEGWGLSVIEANMLGVPAVAYDVPGLNTAIQHEETGLLAASEDEFRQALAAILSDDARHGRYALAARRWAERFDWDGCARTTLELLTAGVVPGATDVRVEVAITPAGAGD